jgi:hypothetical protein
VPRIAVTWVSDPSTLPRCALTDTPRWRTDPTPHPFWDATLRLAARTLGPGHKVTF